MRALALALCCLCGAWPPSATAALSVKDDRGASVVLQQPAHRIVSLAPHATELLFAAGAGNDVVGVVIGDYPPRARRLPRVGDAFRIDLERLLGLRPDLVVAWQSGNPPADLARIEALGIPLYVTEPRRLEQIAEYLRELGHLAGTEEAARSAAAGYLSALEDLRSRHAGLAPVTVFYQIAAQPLVTVNGTHIISQAMALCGGRNVFAALAPLAPAVSLEAVLDADPQAIVVGSWSADPQLELAPWRRWPQLSAVRTGNLYAIPADYLDRAGPRLLTGVRRLCAALDRTRAGGAP